MGVFMIPLQQESENFLLLPSGSHCVPARVSLNRFFIAVRTLLRVQNAMGGICDKQCAQY